MREGTVCARNCRDQNNNDASEYIKELKITVEGEKPTILKTIELFYDRETRMWKPNN